MSESPSTTSAKSRTFAAASSALFVIGVLLLPLTFVAFMVFAIAMFPLFWAGITAPLAIALGFGGACLVVVCELLAIGLGTAGRKHFAGKIGLIGGIVVLVLPLLLWLFQSRH